MSPRPASADLPSRLDGTSPLQLFADSEPVASGAVNRARMRAISRRLAEGHYDRPEVIQQVIERILNEL